MAASVDGFAVKNPRPLKYPLRGEEARAQGDPANAAPSSSFLFPLAPSRLPSSKHRVDPRVEIDSLLRPDLCHRVAKMLNEGRALDGSAKR